MKHTFILLMLSLFLASCNKMDDEVKNSNTNVNMNISANFDFIPIDATGNNLLKTINPLTIDDFDIVLYDNKGKPYYFYDRMLGHPKRIGFMRIFEGNDFVRVFLNGPKDDQTNISITHLRIADKIHIIKGEWEFYPTGSYEIKKVWFDDKPVYNPDEGIESASIFIDVKK